MCFKRKDGRSKNGILVYTVESWRDFCQLVDKEFKLKSNNQKNELCINDYVWRGHRCGNWNLVSSFDRQLQNYCDTYCKENRQKCNNYARCRTYILNKHTNSFAYACRNKLGEFRINVREFVEFTRAGKDRERFWWALGQHYGMVTPMLDWSYSPFVAAFFAFEEVAENQCQRAVWGLKNEAAFYGINSKRNLHQHKNVFEYWDPMSAEYPRLINQRGLFTITKDGKDIEMLVEDAFKDENEPVLVKIKICNKDGNREEFLRGLDSMNINHMTVYPDIYGAARFCNIGIEFDDYARFHGQGLEVEDDPREQT